MYNMFKPLVLVGLVTTFSSFVAAQNYNLTVTVTTTATATHTKTVYKASPAVTLYPQQITDTTSHYEVFRFFVNSNSNDAFAFKNIQLLPNGASSYVGIDTTSTSPVLQWQLENGTLSSWAGLSPNPHKLGPVAGLGNVSSIDPTDLGPTTRQQLVFRNPGAGASTGFNQTQDQWYLQLLSDEGTYLLSNYMYPRGEWHICKRGGNYQLFYYEPSYYFPGNETDAPGCYGVSILTTLGPVDGCSGGVDGGGPCLRYAGVSCSTEFPCTPQRFDTQF